MRCLALIVAAKPNVIIQGRCIPQPDSKVRNALGIVKLAADVDKWKVFAAKPSALP